MTLISWYILSVIVSFFGVALIHREDSGHITIGTLISMFFCSCVPIFNLLVLSGMVSEAIGNLHLESLKNIFNIKLFVKKESDEKD